MVDHTKTYHTNPPIHWDGIHLQAEVNRCEFQCPLCNNSFGRAVKFGRHSITDHKQDGVGCAKEVTRFPYHKRKFSKFVKERFILNVVDTSC